MKIRCAELVSPKTIRTAVLAAVVALVIGPRARSATDEFTAGAASTAERSCGTDQIAENPTAPKAISHAVDHEQAIDLNPPTTTNLPIRPPDRREVIHTLQSVILFGLISLVPVGLMMMTAFVRINIVLILLRQALGSPQVPGNQVLTALALLLTAVVMQPIGDKIYQQAVLPYSSGKVSAAQAWAVGTQPIKAFMVDQIIWTKHQEYLQALYDYAVPPIPERAEPSPGRAEDFPLRVVAPAYLLSELTTALTIGFFVYLPFLVIDLVVSSVLAATGLFMLPPALVAMPVKLIVFVLADGWMLVATMLLSSFTVSSGSL
jgi:flagellar biosynthetic protein FliP